jgi:hypothetical protein
MADEAERRPGNAPPAASAARDAGQGRSGAAALAQPARERSPAIASATAPAKADAAPATAARSGSIEVQSIARPSAPAPVAQSSARRRTLFGRTERDVDLMMYAEGWKQKIELNATLDQLREAKTKPYVDPIVTVAMRSDGSVESVTFNRGSGVPEIDDAIRNIVQKLGPYNAFPPDLAREYDVIEVRRVWTFNVAVRLFASGR